MNPMNVSFEKLALYYARRDKKDPAKWKDVETVMKGLPGTPCCVQMSRAFCGAGLAVPAQSYRRPTSDFRNGLGWRALLATDEVEEFLAERFLDGENLRVGERGLRSPKEIRAVIDNIPGVLVFRHGLRGRYPPKDKFEHTEIWDGKKFMQRDMAEDALLSCPRVLFWPTSDWNAGPADFELS